MKRLLSLILLALCLLDAMAGDKFVKRSTDVLCLTPDATALCLAIAKHDNEGLKQLGLSTATCLAVNYGLELCIKKDGTTFLWKRYGWQWGVPAAVVSSYVAWGRVHTDRHDWWDVLGGAAIGVGSAFIFTRPFMNDVDITVTPTALNDHTYGLTATLTF